MVVFRKSLNVIFFRVGILPTLIWLSGQAVMAGKVLEREILYKDSEWFRLKAGMHSLAFDDNRIVINCVTKGPNVILPHEGLMEEEHVEQIKRNLKLRFRNVSWTFVSTTFMYFEPGIPFIMAVGCIERDSGMPVYKIYVNGGHDGFIIVQWEHAEGGTGYDDTLPGAVTCNVGKQNRADQKSKVYAMILSYSQLAIVFALGVFFSRMAFNIDQDGILRETNNY